MRRSSCSMSFLLIIVFAVSPAVAGVDRPPGVKLTSTQLKRVLVGRSWGASWGPFTSNVIFSKDGVFADGITAPRRWHFAGDQICISAAHIGAYAEHCLDFYNDAGSLHSWFWSKESGKYLATYHGPQP